MQSNNDESVPGLSRALTDDAQQQTRRAAWLPWMIAYACGALIAFLRANHCWQRPSLCMDVYWLEAWLVESSHGLHARGLLGAVTHLIAPQSPNVVVLNAIALAVSTGIVATLLITLYVKTQSVWSRLAVAVVAASPLCALFFEEVGDPLMVDFALFLLAAALIRRTSSRTLRAAVCTVFCLLAVAIHEAAIFLFVPAAVLLYFPPQRLTVGSFVRCALVAAPLLLLILLDHAPRVSNPDYQAVNSLSGEVIPRIEVPFPSYIQLAHEEADIYFASPVKVLQFFLKFPRVWYIQLLGLVLAAGLWVRGSQARLLWRHWIYLSLCSAPLYVIAVDWGRFTTLTFWLSLLIVWLRQSMGTAADPAPLPATFHNIVPERMPAESLLLGVTAALLLAANALYPDYGINGMPAISLPILVPFLLAWAAWRRWSTRQPSTGDSGSEPRP
ncbi:MAG: hypothetical protein JSR66_15530 [Proteobacteria bacterium]|nr:hypothetical protein [Pseudomonadota bacterium]